MDSRKKKLEQKSCFSEKMDLSTTWNKTDAKIAHSFKQYLKIKLNNSSQLDPNIFAHSFNRFQQNICLKNCTT